MATETSFRRWRRKMNLTQEQAADLLGVSKSQIANWDAGIDRGSGHKSGPGLGIRYAMTMFMTELKVEPWPE